MIQQTAINIGNSVGVILPQDIRKNSNIKQGDVLMIKNKGKDIILSPARKKKTGEVNEKFAKLVHEFMEEHDDVLRELAGR